ncbi:MAG TPA: TraB/GumN family protein [Chitinophagales bacterium]|nr:TraB/GumN family protein [Chitinophagales bacterium]
MRQKRFYWSLVIGLWSLVTGHCVLRVRKTTFLFSIFSLLSSILSFSQGIRHWSFVIGYCKLRVRKTVFLFSILYLLCSHFSFSQGNSLLWRITGKKSEPPSYLYGTMHSADPRVFHFADSVLPVFEKCKAFAMEVVVDENSQAIMLENIFMENGSTLKSLLTQGQYDSVQWFAMKNAGLAISFIDKMKPLYVAMMLEMLSGDDSLLTNPDPFLDQYFENEATTQRKKVMGIETVEEQMGIFDIMTYRDQAQLLMKSLREYSADTTAFEQMVHYYLSNDLHNMMSFENDFSLPDSLYNALITNRNLKMATRIDTMIQRQSTFIAVGAGHLGGDQGLVSLLREKGYTVLPIIPTYNHYLKDGWYQLFSLKNNFTADFPSQPEVTTDTMSGKEVWSYSLSEKSRSALNEDFRVLVFPSGMDDDDIRVFLSAKKIADLKFNNSTEEKYFSFQREDKMKGRCLFIYSGDKRYVIVYAAAHKSKDPARFAASFIIN